MTRGPVFILGTQRSGTTWLANIFDSHPACLHYYEPFAPVYGIFPYFPHEFERAISGERELAIRLRADFARLPRYRSRLFDPVHATRRQFLAEAWLMGKLEAFDRRLNTRLFRFAGQFNLLHLNRIGQEPVAWFAKDEIRVVAVKEVRLYFKAGFLATALPEASFIHVIRHPAAVVLSMDNFLKRGRLVEIRDHVGTLVERMRAQPSLTRYEPVLARVRAGSQLDRLAAYWRVANEELAVQLTAVPSRAYALVYEDLATDPLARTADMFAWCGLEPAEATDAFIRSSSTSHSGRDTALDTNRVSATYYRDWVGRVTPEVREAVERVCGDSPLMTRFEPYYRDA